MSQRRADASAAATAEPESTTQPPASPISERSAQPAADLHPVADAPKEPTAPAPQTTAPAGRSDSVTSDESSVQATIDALQDRVDKLERRNKRSRLMAFVFLIGLGYFGFNHFFPDGVVVQQTLMESTEVKLVDNDGNARLFLRMFSRVPVLQILGDNGTPRMSLGLRFDNTPFIDLSDKNGRTRATFEMTEDDTPLIQFYDENGNRTTRLN